MNWRSTTFRFAALVFLCQLVASAALIVSLTAVLRSQSTTRAEAVAETIRDDLLAIYAQGGTDALAAAIRLRGARATAQGETILLADGKGRLLAGNLRAWPASLDDSRGYREFPAAPGAGARTALVRATRLPSGERLLTGIVVEGDKQLFALVERAAALVLGLALVIAAISAWLVARAIANRLEAPVGTLKAVRGGDLARRVPTDHSKDAFARLGDEINFTLDRVEALIGELKIATDGLAHDLKSPLTRLRVALERTVAVAHEPAVRSEAERALAEGERLLELVETALRISRAEAGIGRESFAEIDLSEMLESIGEIYAPLVEDNDRAIEILAAPVVTWPVHRQLLGQAIGNLIDNSVKYGAGTIILALGRDEGIPTISVRDRGNGIPAELRPEALRRFGRLDAARQGTGAGLGLALVQAVAHLHGGSLSLDDAEPGLAVTIRLGGASPA